ncbi:hypothetical protein GA0115240_161913, partial [Streptomyces sp. DvalAA-14]
MTPWARGRGDSARKRAGRKGAAGAAEGSSDASEADAGSVPVLVEDHDGLLLLRAPLDDALEPADIVDLTRQLRSRGGIVTLVVGAHAAAADAVWPRLNELLDSLRAEGATAVRLAMASAGDDQPGRPSAARQIAEAWGITVEAPDGAVLAVPGGSLFIPAGSWWRFAPGAKPVPLGPRCPAPSWHVAVDRLPARTSAGCAVHQLPAGVLVRPVEAAATEPGDFFHAVPVDPWRPAVVVGVPWGEDVSAEEVADLLAGLPKPKPHPGSGPGPAPGPGSIPGPAAGSGPGSGPGSGAGSRSGPGAAESAAPPAPAALVRLIPGGHQDLLPLGRRVADLLGSEVEVTTGLPLFAASGPMASYAARSVLMGTDGTPGWLPFVDAVVCRPSRGGQAVAPQLLRWSPPLPGPGRPEDGIVRLSDRWQVTATRAGLWVDAPNRAHPLHTARQVVAEGPAIEVGTPGERLDGSLWPDLSRLLGALGADLRTRATLYVHGTPLDGGRELRHLAVQHGLRTIRYATTAPGGGSRLGAGPRPAGPRPGSPAGPGPGPLPASGTAAPLTRPPGTAHPPTPAPSARPGEVVRAQGAAGANRPPGPRPGTASPFAPGLPAPTSNSDRPPPATASPTAPVRPGGAVGAEGAPGSGTDRERATRPGSGTASPLAPGDPARPAPGRP